MIDRTFIEEIIDVASNVTTEEHNGCAYTNRALHMVKPPTVECMTVHTLSGIVDYMKSVIDGETNTDVEKPFIQVVDFNKVVVRSAAGNAERVRESFIKAELIADPFSFGHDISAEKFVIAMQAKFVRDEMVNTILKVSGNITAKAEVKTLDDGVTQTTTAKTGIAKVENVVVPNPVTLRPYRTFVEVDQPASDFVFRMKANNSDTPTCALHEADGGAWKNSAIKSIKEYFEYELPGVVVLA